MRLSLFIFFFIISTSCIYGQDHTEEYTKPSNKGKIYGFYGWNRGWYTNSDIHFQGNDYDFILKDVKATDRQTPFNFNTYFNPTTISIPQTGYRIGYFITDKIDVSIGVDHMKYVMIQEQSVEITGSIENETLYHGKYNNDDISLTQAFLKFEHTDGLNYLNAEVTLNEDLLTALKLKVNSDKIQLDYLIGFGVGTMMPKSNVTLMNNSRNDEFHFAGYAFAFKSGLNLTLYKYLFFRSELKGGFTHLTDIRTTPSETDRARQFFFFGQLNVSIGFSINPFN